MRADDPVQRAVSEAMRVEVLVRGGSDTVPDLRGFAMRRLAFAIGRLQHRVRDVTVRMVDENGPRRGVDSRCSMNADLVDGGRLFVEATAASPFAAITIAAWRLSEALRRAIGRTNVRRRSHAVSLVRR